MNISKYNFKIAIIPARGGSKRIPHKNIKFFHGKPIIAWSIETAIKSGLFDKVIVSTDDNEIAEISTKYGAEIPFIRPEILSNDFATTGEVIEHAINFYIQKNKKPNLICTLYATAPFVTPDDLKDSFHQMLSNNKHLGFSATEFTFPIQRGFFINNGLISMYQPEHYLTRSQDLNKAYHDAGQFYWTTDYAIENKFMMFGENSHPYIIPRYKVCDIDNLDDWNMAEIQYEYILRNMLI
jgi:pseudaminic acid cytidylyltransferase